MKNKKHMQPLKLSVSEKDQYAIVIASDRRERGNLESKNLDCFVAIAPRNDWFGISAYLFRLVSSRNR